jgi:hypothetical protein
MKCGSPRPLAGFGRVVTAQPQRLQELHALEYGVELFWFRSLCLLQAQICEGLPDDGKPRRLRVVLFGHGMLLKKGERRRIDQRYPSADEKSQEALVGQNAR